MEGRLSNWLTGGYPTISVWSPLAAVYVPGRIEAALDYEDQQRRGSGWLDRFAASGEGRVVSTYVNGQLVLRVRGGRNSWRPGAAVEVLPAPTGGSMVLLHPRSQAATMVFLWIWLSLALLIGVSGLVDGVWEPLIMLPVGIGIHALGRATAAAQLEVIHDWIARCVESPP